MVAAHRGRRDDALDRLPLPYSTALRLRDAGITNEVIAERVGVEPEAMDTFMRLAQAKLDAAGYRANKGPSGGVGCPRAQWSLAREVVVGTATVSGVWPLTGRDEELRLITESIGDSSEPVGVAIIGAAGVGKSRLAREAATVASGGGATVRWTAGTQSASTIPLGAFSQWLADIDGGALQLVGAVIDALTAPGGARVVVAVDDAHLLDDLSAFVLYQLVLRRAAFVIVTIRSGEAVPDAVTALWKDGYLQLLELQPLSRTESDTLLSGALVGQVEPDSARRMWELTGGNVLYLRHLVTQETASRRSVQHAGTWAWTGPPVVSSTLIDLIESQVGVCAGGGAGGCRPGRGCRAIRRPGAVRAGGAVSGGRCRAARTGRGHAQRGRCGRARRSPPLRRDPSRSGGSAAASQATGRVASALANGADLDDTDIVRLGVLWLDSDLPADAQLLFDAARAAFLRFDLGLAERLADASVRAGHTADAALLRAQALGLLNRAAESEDVLASLCASEIDDRQRAYALTLRASNLWTQLGRTNESWDLVEAALQGSNPVVRESMRAFRVVQLSMLARPVEAIAMSRQHDRKGLGDFEYLASLGALAIALGDTGRISDVAELALDGPERAKRSSQAAYLGIALAEYHVKALLLAGSIPDAVATGQSVYRHLCGRARHDRGHWVGDRGYGGAGQRPPRCREGPIGLRLSGFRCARAPPRGGATGSLSSRQKYWRDWARWNPRQPCSRPCSPTRIGQWCSSSQTV